MIFLVAAVSATAHESSEKGPETNPQAIAQPTLHTGEQCVDEVTRPTTLDVKHPMAVLTFVLDNLPDRVKVYPTESIKQDFAYVAAEDVYRRQAGERLTYRFACVEDGKTIRRVWRLPIGWRCRPQAGN